MLPRPKFDSYTPEFDPYYGEPADIRLHDLKFKSKRKPKISVLISTYNRQAQLSRALECYARQTFRDFEILINNDGSTQDIFSTVYRFTPFINIKYFYTPRDHWVSCPSTAYSKMYPEVEGDVIVVAHPEMMLTKDALKFISDVLLKDKLEKCNTYVIDNPGYDGQITWKWVSLRPNFFDKDSYKLVDTVDWHKNARNIEKIPGWDNVYGFAARQNIKHKFIPFYPWWFVGAALKISPIWLDTPITVGHGNIDMFWCYYRKKYKYLDVVPDKVMCYHQVHQTSAVAPDGEQNSIIPKEEGAKCQYVW